MPEAFDPASSRPPAGTPISRETTAPRARQAADDKVLCERCTQEMFRMHAVWRCPACGFKTDCCGW